MSELITDPSLKSTCLYARDGMKILPQSRDQFDAKNI